MPPKGLSAARFAIMIGTLAAVLYGLLAACGVPAKAAAACGASMASAIMCLLLTYFLFPGDRRPYSSITASRLLAILKSKGLTANLFPARALKLIIAEILPLRLFFSVTEAGDMIKFTVEFATDKATSDTINRWHSEYLFTRCFMGDDGAALVNSELDLRGGVCEARIRDFIESCLLATANWCEVVLLGKEPSPHPCDRNRIWGA